MTDKPLAKSLHTVTVLVRLAKHFLHTEDVDGPEALQMALVTLHLDAMPDPYGLRVVALKQLAGEVR